MTEMLSILIYVIAAFVLLFMVVPKFIFVVMKVGTFGFLAGRRAFEEHVKRREKNESRRS